jgi:hypothetical protein
MDLEPLKIGVGFGLGAIDVKNRLHRALGALASRAGPGVARAASGLPLIVSATALLIAGTAALGAFDSDSNARAPDPTPGPRIALSYTPEPDSGPLVITYYLVDTHAALEALLVTENQLVHREWLRKNDMEVLLVVDEQGEAAAREAYEEARRRTPFASFELVDLRQ